MPRLEGAFRLRTPQRTHTTSSPSGRAIRPGRAMALGLLGAGHRVVSHRPKLRAARCVRDRSDCALRQDNHLTLRGDVECRTMPTIVDATLEGSAVSTAINNAGGHAECRLHRVHGGAKSSGVKSSTNATGAFLMAVRCPHLLERG